MAYYRGKGIEKSGGNAMQEVILEKRSIAQVARRFGKNIKFIDRKLNCFIRYYNYDRIYLGIGLKTPYEVLHLRCYLRAYIEFG